MENALAAPTREWIEPERSVPVTEVRAMAKLVNRRRRFVRDGEPLELGVFDHTDVTLLHVFDASAEGALERRAMTDPGAIRDYRESEQQEAAEKLHALVDDIGLAGATMRLVPLTNTLARTILESAEHEAADLIIVGTSRRKGFARLLVGSIAGDVIRDTHRDILIVPIA